MSSVQATFLGTGDAFSAGGSHQAGYLVQGAGTTCLLDCGATTLRSMKRHGIDADVIDRVWLSHLHGDHFAGLPFLFLEYLYERKRQRPLEVIGPPGTQSRVWDLFRAMYKETASKPLPFVLKFIEVQPGVPVDLGELRFEPLLVPHQEKEISLALRLKLDGKTVLYSGDTGWTEDLLRYSENTDLFICECCYFETRLEIHLDYPRLAAERSRFGTQRLILTHLGREVLRRRDEVETEMARDGLVITLP
jgi:ribonuclease BN (tRNA processing enzyme)